MNSHAINEVYPYLRVRDAAAAITFYRQAFGAIEDFRLTEPGGRIGHAQLTFGNFTVMLSDEYPEYGIQGPMAFGGTGSSVHLHVDDVDAMTKQAVDAGATLLMPPSDQFYGERASKVRDPFGHEWLIGSHIEEVSREEMQRRFTAMFDAATSTEGHRPPDNEAQVRILLETWAANTRTSDKERILSGHFDDALIYDVLPPMKYEGTASYRASWDEWWPETVGEVTFDLHDLSIDVGGNVAFATAMIHCAGNMTNGHSYDDHVRATFCLRKMGGHWKIKHQHISMPLKM